MEKLEDRIEAFKSRIQVEPAFCQELFEQVTIRLLALKYAYYELNVEIVKDYAYDMEERGWYVMGRALGVLAEDEVSPCVDFNVKHPLAARGIVLANKLK